MNLSHARRIAIAIIVTCLLQAHGNAASAGLADIANAFPNLSEETVSLVLTSMMVSLVPAMVLAGVLVRKIGEKRLVMIGFSMILVFGLSSFFTRSFPLLLASRVLTGIGTGLVMPVQGALIPLHFTGYRAQRLFGLQSATVSILGVAYGLIGGFLASIQWNYLFLIFVMAVPAILVLWFWLPAQPTVDESERPQNGPFRVDRHLLYLAGIFFLVSTMLFTFATGIAYLMEEKAVGTGAAGLCVAMFNAGSFGCSLLYDRIRKRTGIWSIPMGIGFVLTGLAIIGTSGMLNAPLPFYLIGAGISGSGIGTMMPAMASRVTHLFRNDNTSLALAVVFGSFMIGSLASPYITSQAAYLPSGDTYSGRFLYAAAGLLILLVAVRITWKRGIGKEEAAEG